jgi:hypothetical protein
MYMKNVQIHSGPSISFQRLYCSVINGLLFSRLKVCNILAQDSIFLHFEVNLSWMEDLLTAPSLRLEVYKRKEVVPGCNII